MHSSQVSPATHRKHKAQTWRPTLQNQSPEHNIESHLLKEDALSPTAAMPPGGRLASLMQRPLQYAARRASL